MVGVEVYLGPGRRSLEGPTLTTLARYWNELGLGPFDNFRGNVDPESATSDFYFHGVDEDSARRFVEAVNELQGYCAKVVGE